MFAQFTDSKAVIRIVPFESYIQAMTKLNISFAKFYLLSNLALTLVSGSGFHTVVNVVRTHLNHLRVGFPSNLTYNLNISRVFLCAAWMEIFLINQWNERNWDIFNIFNNNAITGKILKIFVFKIRFLKY